MTRSRCGYTRSASRSDSAIEQGPPVNFRRPDPASETRSPNAHAGAGANRMTIGSEHAILRLSNGRTNGLCSSTERDG
jgi:hypothetical protein